MPLQDQIIQNLDLSILCATPLCRRLRQRERRAKAREEKELDCAAGGASGGRSPGATAEDDDAELGADDGSDSDEHLCDVEEDSAGPPMSSDEEGPISHALPQPVEESSAAPASGGPDSRQPARRAASKLQIDAWLRYASLHCWGGLLSKMSGICYGCCSSKSGCDC